MKLIALPPDVIQQLLRWKMLESLVQMLGGIFMFGTAIFLVFSVKAYAKRNKWLFSDEDSEGAAVGQGVIYVAVHVFAIVAFICMMSEFDLTWLQIWVAPKVYLIEYAKGGK